jgi:hypothetical protein
MVAPSLIPAYYPYGHLGNHGATITAGQNAQRDLLQNQSSVGDAYRALRDGVDRPHLDISSQAAWQPADALANNLGNGNITKIFADCSQSKARFLLVAHRNPGMRRAQPDVSLPRRPGNADNLLGRCNKRVFAAPETFRAASVTYWFSCGWPCAAGQLYDDPADEVRQSLWQA